MRLMDLLRDDWEHPNDRPAAVRKRTEPSAGTHWWFVASVIGQPTL